MKMFGSKSCQLLFRVGNIHGGAKLGLSGVGRSQGRPSLRSEGESSASVHIQAGGKITGYPKLVKYSNFQV